MTIGIVCVAAHGGSDRRCKVGDDDIDAKMDELGRNLAGAVTAPTGIADIERDVPVLRIAKGLQTPPERIGERMRRRRGDQHADERQFSRLLRQRRRAATRPPHRRAAAWSGLKLWQSSY